MLLCAKVFFAHRMCKKISHKGKFTKRIYIMEKSAGIALEFKDLDTSKRTAVIRHSVYGSIDKVGDVAHPGMFTKSWQENKPKIYVNHNPNKVPGTANRMWDDNTSAFTEFKFGNWTYGNDVLEMASEGVFTGASFGYRTIKKDFGEVKGKRVRNLREVKHEETSLLNVEAAHPDAGLVSLIKSLDEISEDEINELLTWGSEHITSLKSYVQKIESYCRKAKASDETIISMQNGLLEYKQIISSYDTAITSLATKPVASDDEVKNQLNNFLTSFNLRQWQKKPL